MPSAVAEGEPATVPSRIGSGEAGRGRGRLAVRLVGVATALVAAMPAVLVVAHRSSPLVLTLAAAAALAALWCEGRVADAVRELGRGLGSPLGLACGAFLAWACLSLAWSPDPRLASLALAEFAGTLAVVAILLLALPPRLAPTARTLFLGGVATAAVLVLLDLWSDLAFRRALDLRVAYFVHNRPVLTLAALAAAVAALLRHSRAFAAVALGLVLLAVSQAESGAAVLGLAAGAIAFGAARLLPQRLVTSLAALALGLALLAAPLAGSLMADLIPPALHGRLKGTSPQARVDIARAFGEAALAEPWTGQGFAASARLAGAPVAERVPAPLRPLLGVGHPHNAALQTWVELGLPGVLLALAALALLLRNLAALPRGALAPRLALLMGATAVSLVGHGAWQGWWPAALGTALLWLRFADRPGGKGTS